MITIGFRADPKAVTFVVYNSETQTILNIEEIKIPLALEIPDRLKYIRSNLLDVIREYKVERAGIRITEPNADASKERVEIEGVIQEAFASSDLAGYYVGQISSISRRAGIDRQDFKLLVQGKREYPVENWGNMKEKEREALITAVGAVNV